MRLLPVAALLALAACSPSPQSLSEAAEQRANAGGAPEPPFAVTLIAPLRTCSAAAARDAMGDAAAARRAAGALCAATLPCGDATVDDPLARLLDDAAVAVEYVNRGPIAGSGDQRVQHTVGFFAHYATDQRRASFRAGHERCAP